MYVKQPPRKKRKKKWNHRPKKFRTELCGVKCGCRSSAASHLPKSNVVSRGNVGTMYYVLVDASMIDKHFFVWYFSGSLRIAGGDPPFGRRPNDGQPTGWNSQTLHCQTHCGQRPPLAQRSWTKRGFDHQFWHCVSGKIIQHNKRSFSKSFARKIRFTNQRQQRPTKFNVQRSFCTWCLCTTILNVWC